MPYQMIMREALFADMSVTNRGDCKMMDRIWTQHLGLVTICFGMIGAAIYFLMLNVTLAHIEATSGHVPFDMRPLGYGLQDAVALLDELGEDGRRYYLNRQIPLDTVYPALLALTLISAIRWFGRRLHADGLVRIGVILSSAAAVFDYIENIGVVAMITSWPDLPNAVVYASSIATVAKSALTTAAIICCILVGLIWVKQLVPRAT
jgi:hypothetical protein